MAVKYQPRVIKSRFIQTGGFSPAQMNDIASGLLSRSIKPRIISATTVDDTPAPPLKEAYRKWKENKFPPAIRNWIKTGRTMRSLNVLTISQNKAVIGFVDRLTNFRAFINNRRSRQFGVSPKDQKVLLDSVIEAGTVVKATQLDKVG